MTIIITPQSIAEAKMLGLPDNLLYRWARAIQNDRLIEWRSFAFLLSAEAKMAAVDNQFATCNALLALFDVAMQHVYDYKPQEVMA